MRWGGGVSSLQMPFPEPVPSDTEMSTSTSSPDTQLDIPARGPATQSGKSVHFHTLYSSASVTLLINQIAKLIKSFAYLHGEPQLSSRAFGHLSAWTCDVQICMTKPFSYPVLSTYLFHGFALKSCRRRWSPHTGGCSWARCLAWPHWGFSCPGMLCWRR